MLKATEVFWSNELNRYEVVRYISVLEWPADENVSCFFWRLVKYRLLFSRDHDFREFNGGGQEVDRIRELNGRQDQDNMPLLPPVKHQSFNRLTAETIASSEAVVMFSSMATPKILPSG